MWPQLLVCLYGRERTLCAGSDGASALMRLRGEAVPNTAPKEGAELWPHPGWLLHASVPMWLVE